MKKQFLLLFLILFSAMILVQGCKKDSDDKNDSGTSLGGDPSPMGDVGTLVYSLAGSNGIGAISASVVASNDGISTYSGSCEVTNDDFKSMLAEVPGITVTGNNVVASGVKIKQTTEGIESYISTAPGIIVKYASAVGDTYPVGSTGINRKVISKSTPDDYYYGGIMIKVIQVEEPMTGLKSLAVTKITYIANHRFGLVGIKYNFNDGSNLVLPLYCNTTNGK